MNALQFGRILLANPNRAMLIGLVLLVNYGYRTIVGYESTRSFLVYSVAPAKLYPLQDKKLPGRIVKSVEVSGVSLPAAWHPKVVKSEGNLLRFRCRTGRAKLIVTAVRCPNGLDENSSLRFELDRLARVRFGNWDAFRKSFGSDRQMLDDILSAEMPRHIDSLVFPLFPHPTRHFRRAELLVGKRFLANTAHLWRVQGRTRFFYVIGDSMQQGCQLYLGSLKTGKVEGDLLVTTGEKLKETDLLTILAAIDRGTFAPPVAAKKPR